MNKKYLKELLIILLLLFLSFPATKALFIPGGFTSHDLTHHVVRQISMNKLLSEGQFPPRWSGELNNGYGYPVFLFNYPLPAMVGEIFHKLGLGYVDSVKTVLFTSMVMSVLGMYLFLNSLLKSRMAAFLGAIFYLYAPLRFLTVYVSAAVGSALALGILPFVFWSLVELKSGKKWPPLVGGLSLAALILSHNVTALLFAPVILAFWWVILRRSLPRVKSRGSGQVGVMFLLGLGLSAWFWLPAVFEAQYTRFNELFGKFYQDQFPTIWQLLRSPWGYGLSHPQRPEPGDMSYQLGLAHIAVVLVYGLWFMVYGRKDKDKSVGIFALVTFFLSVFLILKVSLPLWENTPFLAMVQFPLRFSAIAVFSASIAAALLVKYLPFKKLVFMILLVLVLYANRNHWNINQVFEPGEEYYLNMKSTSTTFGEHLPKWGRVMDRPSSAKFEFVGGVGEMRIVRDNSGEVLAEVEATQAGKLRLNQFYFPGWEIKVDNEVASFDYLSDTESYGLPIFDIDPGSHQVEAQFRNTPIRNLADGISLISVVVFLYAGYNKRFNKR